MVTVAETNARWSKATAFAAHLFTGGVKSFEVPYITDKTWVTLAAAIDENPPRSGATVEAIAFILRTFEAAAQRMERESASQTVDLSTL